MRRLLPLLLIFIILAGCSPFGPSDEDLLPPEATPSDSSNQSPGESGAPVTISFAAGDYERQVYEQLAEAFTAENPNISVAIVPIEDLSQPINGPGAPESPLTALRRLVSGADTAPSGFATPEAYGSNLLYNLQPLMEADASFNRDDFYAGAIERYTVQNGTWVLPRYFYVQLLDYNSDLFTQANVPAPTAADSWEQLIAVAEQIAQKNGNTVERYGLYDWSGGFFPLLALLQSQGVDLLNTPPEQVQLDSPEIASAVERIRALQTSGALFQPQYREGPPDESQDPMQLIRNGRIAMWPSDALGVREDGTPMTADLPFEVGKIPYPTVAGLDFGGGDGYIISGGTQHPNEAWKWIEFLTRQQTDPQQPGGMVYAPPNRVPARQSLAEQIGFWDNVAPEQRVVYEAAIENGGKAPPASFNSMTIGMTFNALQSALFQLASDPNADVRKALAEAQRQLDEQIAQVELTPIPTPDTSAVVVATPPPIAAPAGATEIVFSGWASNPTDLRRLARSFNEQNPAWFVKITSTNTFTGPVEIKDLARTSDCFSWWGAPQIDADFEALLNIQPLIDADASFPRDEFAPALLAPYQRSGALFGLPYAFNVRTLAYNRTAFDAAGLQVPSHEWTPSDFLAAAQALTKGEGDQKQFGYVPQGGAQQDLFFFISQFGGQLTTGSGVDTRANFDDPRVAEAIQWYYDLANVHKVMPEFRIPYQRDDQGYEDRSYELVQNGRAGMWFDYGVNALNNQPFMEPAAGRGPDGERPFETGVAPLPIGGAGLHVGDFNVRGLHISAETQQAQGCWEWLKFMSTDLAGLQGDIPARASVAASEAFAAQSQPGLPELYAAYQPALQRSGSGSNIYDVYRLDTYWLFKAIDEAQQGKADLRTALAEAQQTTNVYMECLATQKDKFATCAKQADPAYQGYNVEDPQVGPVPRG